MLALPSQTIHLSSPPILNLSSLVAQIVNLPTMQQIHVESWVRKIPWRMEWLPTPVFLPGKSPWTEEPGRL